MRRSLRIASVAHPDDHPSHFWWESTVLLTERSRSLFFFLSFSLSLSLGKDVLIPLTSSLYVGGTLGNPDNVMVDIGTGYYVEKTAEGGRDYCKRKVMILTKALEDLAEIIKAKRQQVQQCQRVLQMKMQQFQQQEQQGASV